jgi:hypothetical protein
MHSACRGRLGAARAARWGPAVCGVLVVPGVVTYSSGFRCGLVSDVECKRASDPPWTGATWTARMRSDALGGVRDTASEMPDPTMAARPTHWQLPS